MRITINERFFLETEETNYSLYENKIVQKEGKTKGQVKEKALAYNIPVETAINKIAHVLSHEKETVVTLKEFLKEYKEEKEKFEKLLKELDV